MAEKQIAKVFSLPKVKTLVEVRPVEIKKWHGKSGQESFTRPKSSQALVNGESMTYDTGLTKEEIEALEKVVKYDLTNHFNTEEPHPFWDSPMSKVKLENNTMFFDISQPLNYIKVKVMKASKYVANSMIDYENGLFPEATHVIFDEAEQAEVLATKVQQEEDAIIAASSMSKDRKIELVLALSGKNLKGQSDNFVKVELNKVIKKDTTEFLRLNTMDKIELSNYSLVLEALQKSVLRKDGHKILYHDSILGMEELEVAKYLMLDDNQELKLRIMAQVN